MIRAAHPLHPGCVVCTDRFRLSRVVIIADERRLAGHEESLIIGVELDTMVEFEL